MEAETIEDKDRPLCYGSGEQYLPALLEKDDSAIFINKAIEAALGIEACIRVILANECAKDNVGNGQQLILDRYTQQGLIYAALSAANFIADAGARRLDRMDDIAREAKEGIRR